MEVVKKQEKKPTNAQLQRRIDTAYVFVPKDKESKSIFFDDKGLRLTITLDYAIVETLGHSHVFRQFVGGNISRPYIYLKRFVDFAFDNLESIETKDDKNNPIGYSYAKMFEVLKEKDEIEYAIAQYTDWWLFNIFYPLYNIGETVADTTIVYEDYCHNLAKNEIILQEHKEDVTASQFIEMVLQKERVLVGDVKNDTIAFPALSDEERVKQELEAAKMTDAEQYLEERMNEEQTKESKEDGK